MNSFIKFEIIKFSMIYYDIVIWVVKFGDYAFSYP
jgi:hypothetical protein